MNLAQLESKQQPNTEIQAIAMIKANSNLSYLINHGDLISRKFQILNALDAAFKGNPEKKDISRISDLLDDERVIITLRLVEGYPTENSATRLLMQAVVSGDSDIVGRISDIIKVLKDYPIAMRAVEEHYLVGTLIAERRK